MLPDILPMRPFYREQVWGGRDLEAHFGKDLPSGKLIGESWEISAYHEMESIVASGPMTGRGLADLHKEHRADLVGDHVYERYGEDFPLLIKLIDARQDLSVQVHPDDGYVARHGLGAYGKDEAWYVLRSDGGRVACGLVEGIDRPAFESAVRENRTGDAIRLFTAQAGDVVHVPPGRVHALCTGVMIYEVQQSSDLTFRIWDYDRPGQDGSPRDLNVDRALDVIDFEGDAAEPTHWGSLPGATESWTVLVDTDHYRLERFVSGRPPSEHTYTSFAAITILSGNARLSGPHDSHTLEAGQSALIPAGLPVSIAASDAPPTEYLIASIP